MIQAQSRIGPKAGFTLIEVLITLSIIAVISAAVVIGAGASRDRSAQAEAHRLAVKLRAAADQALLSQHSFRFEWTEDGYRFETLGDDGTYSPVENDPLAADSGFFAGMHLESDLARNFIIIRPDGLGDEATFRLSTRSSSWFVHFDGLKAAVSQNVP